MGLDADKAWERELPLELTVSMDQVQWTLERVEAGEDAEKVHFPEHAPHTLVSEPVASLVAQGCGADPSLEAKAWPAAAPTVELATPTAMYSTWPDRGAMS